MTNQWTFNDSEEGFWCHDQFDTKEEAIKAAIEYSNDEGQPMFVGKVTEVPVPNPIYSEDIIGRVYDMLEDEDGEDRGMGDRFTRDLTTEQMDGLEEIMKNAWNSWVEKYNVKTNSLTITCVEPVKVLR